MKIATASLMLLFAAVLAGQAGSFGGPPPFTNGSPLVSGVDGSYQATARGKNLTGVFRFRYANGSQTSDPQLPTGTVSGLLTDTYNDYVFFVEGTVFRGLVQANINISEIAGVLDNGGANIVNASVADSANTFLTIQAFMNGFFNGCMDENSPFASFRGRGTVDVTSYAEDEFGNLETIGFFIRDFKFSGVRNATGTPSTSTTTTSTTSG